MRLFGNYGTIRAGATAGIEFYWNRQWTVNYKAASATLIKTVKLNNEDLTFFYAKGKCESGNLVLKISQGNMEKSINLSGKANEKVDMTGFSAGLIELLLIAKSARNMKVIIGWRR